VSSREERLARNEAASREINERIEEAYQGEPPANQIDIVCECARMTCDAAITWVCYSAPGFWPSRCFYSPGSCGWSIASDRVVGPPVHR
jgi:hypothetical protein